MRRFILDCAVNPGEPFVALLFLPFFQCLGPIVG